MRRWATITATALVSLAWAGCASDEDPQVTPAPQTEQAQATSAVEALRAAGEALEDMCLTGPVLDEDDETAQTPAAIDVVVDDLIRAFYLVGDRSTVEDEIGEALGVLADGCASSATVRRLAVATGVEDDDEDALMADARPEDDDRSAYDCDAQGINANEGMGGTCVSAAGERVTVVDRGETARTPAMEVTLLDVETRRSLRRDAKNSRRADGVFVVLTMRVGNRLEEPVAFDPEGQVELYLEGQPYFNIEQGTTTIEPGEKRTGTVAFDVPEDVADSLDTSGNVFVRPFAAAAFDDDGQATIAVLRTYQ